MPVNYTCPEAYALLAAAEASAACRADLADAGVMEIDANSEGPAALEGSCGVNPERAVAPPTKFYKIFWGSSHIAFSIRVCMLHGTLRNQDLGPEKWIEAGC